MTSLTRNLPWFVRDLGVGTIGEVRFSPLCPFLVLGTHFIGFAPQTCYVSLVENLNVADVACLKLSLSKGLGIGIVVGGSIMKVPQLLLSE